MSDPADEQPPGDSSRPFWQSKTLAEMSLDEWDSLCDGCGRCCLHKLEESDTGEIHYTNVACSLLDTKSCQCGDYTHRTFRVPDCVELTPQTLKTVRWLPPTCAYRLLFEGKELRWWHPLVSGDPETVHTAGISVRGRVVREGDARDLDDYIVDWPGEDPDADG